MHDKGQVYSSELSDHGLSVRGLFRVCECAA